MIKLLKYLATNLEKEDLYNLAMFLSDNPDVIDQETLLHIINEVDSIEKQGIKVNVDHSMYDKIKKNFEEKDDMRLQKKFDEYVDIMLYRNNIGLN